MTPSYRMWLPVAPVRTGVMEHPIVTGNVLISLILSTLMIDVICSSETSVLTGVTQRKFPQDGILHSQTSNPATLMQQLHTFQMFLSCKSTTQAYGRGPLLPCCYLLLGWGRHFNDTTCKCVTRNLGLLLAAGGRFLRRALSSFWGAFRRNLLMTTEDDTWRLCSAVGVNRPALQ
jgi:hypothetical protein